MLVAALAACANTTANTSGDATTAPPDASPDALPDAPADATAAPDAAPVVPPDPALRPLLPGSGSAVGSGSPTLRWAPPSRGGDVVVELCRDRAMRRGCRPALRTQATRARVPGGALEPGWWFWRVRVAGDTADGRVWQLRVPRGERAGAADSAWGVGSDFDGDGLDDVAVHAAATRDAPASLWVRYGAPVGATARRGGFALTVGEPGFESAGGSAALVGDVDGDGFVDLGAVVTRSGGGRVDYRLLLLRGGPDGLSSPAVVASDDVAATALSLRAAGDLDGDGYADALVLTNGASGRATSLRRGAPGGFAAAPVALAGPVAAQVGAADFNGDGRGDLVGVDPMGSWWIGLGADGALPRWEARAIPGVATSTARLDPLGDVNGDGRTDLVARFVVPGFHGSGTEVQVHRDVAAGAAGVAVLPGNLEQYVTDLASLGDVDGDGFDDLSFRVESSFSRTRLNYAVWGAPSASPPAREAAPSDASALSWHGDADGDGVGDAVLLRTPPSTDPAALPSLLIGHGAAGARTFTRTTAIMSGLPRDTGASVVTW